MLHLLLSSSTSIQFNTRMNRKDHNRLFLLHANGNCKSKSTSLLFFLCFVVSLSTAQTQTPPAPPLPANPFGSVGHNFNPSMAIVMVILVTAFFFMGFFSVYIRQCNGMRTHGGNRDLDGAVNFGRRSGRLARGLDPSVIESFPTFLYSLVKGLKIGKDTLECAVCLNEFQDDETLRMIPICNHVFHPDCIDAWLSSHSTCPVCRANLVPEPDETITTCANVHVNDSDTEPENDNPRTDEISHIDVINQASDIESPDANLVNPNMPNNQNKQQRSRSTGWMLNRFFPRSHSTGHSLVQPGVNCERFTLRLPEDVRSQLMNSSLSRTLPRLSSSKKGYRSRSLGRNYFNYERFDRPDRWGFTTTPFFSRLGSVRSPKPMVGNGDESSATPSKGLSKSIKSSFDRLFIGGEADAGERSSDQLRSENHV